MLGWIGLAVLLAGAVFVVIRLLRSWGIAFRRYGPGSEPPPGHEPPPDGPPPGAGPA